MSYRSAPPRVTWRNVSRPGRASRQEKNVENSFRPKKNPVADPNMTPFHHFSLIILGAVALATSLLRKKKAGYVALVGAGLLLTAALLDSDPVLALGTLALLAIRCAFGVRRAPQPAPKAPPPGQDP